MATAAAQPVDREVEAVELERLRSARAKTFQSLASLKDRVEEDVLLVPHETSFGGNAFKTKSTVPTHPALRPRIQGRILALNIPSSHNSPRGCGLPRSP